jgi:hypothetical protein
MPLVRPTPSTTVPSLRSPAWLVLVVQALVALALGGCAGVTPPAATAPPTTGAPQAPADQRAALPAALATERQWLQQWFEGTPVLIAQRNDGAVTIDVPREFCFDAGRSSIRPALAAVLDKVAESLRRTPLARLPLLAAPDDAAGTAGLGVQRATQMQKHLLARGVPAPRLGKPTATVVAAVQLRIEPAPP